MDIFIENPHRHICTLFIDKNCHLYRGFRLAFHTWHLPMAFSKQTIPFISTWWTHMTLSNSIYSNTYQTVNINRNFSSSMWTQFFHLLHSIETIKNSVDEIEIVFFHPFSGFFSCCCLNEFLIPTSTVEQFKASDEFPAICIFRYCSQVWVYCQPNSNSHYQMYTIIYLYNFFVVVAIWKYIGSEFCSVTS